MRKALMPVEEAAAPFLTPEQNAELHRAPRPSSRRPATSVRARVSSWRAGRDDLLRRSTIRRQVVDTVLSGSYRPATSSPAATTADHRDNRSLLACDPAGAARLLDQAGPAARPGRHPRPGRYEARTEGRPRRGLRPQPVGAGADPAAAAEGRRRRHVEDPRPRRVPQARAAGDDDPARGNGARTDPDIPRTAFSRTRLDLARTRDPGLRQALDAQAATPDPARRAAYVAQAQRRLLEQGYQVPVFEMTSLYGLTARVHDLGLARRPGRSSTTSGCRGRSRPLAEPRSGGPVRPPGHDRGPCPSLRGTGP